MPVQSSERRPRRFDREVDGIVLLDKPQGLSSNAALQEARGIFRALKAGHAGSLDPMATGMLRILTRLA
jgi:tRNA pseudouridine55 synthase